MLACLDALNTPHIQARPGPLPLLAHPLPLARFFTQVCETLLEEGRHRREDEEGLGSRLGASKRLFGPSVVSLGAGLGGGAAERARDGPGPGPGPGSDAAASAAASAAVKYQEDLSRLLASRTTAAVRFSPLQVCVCVLCVCVCVCVLCVCVLCVCVVCVCVCCVCVCVCV